MKWVTRRRPKVDRIAGPWLAKNNSALEHLARVVCGADEAQHDLTPESRGLLAIVAGFGTTVDEDNVQLAAQLPGYDGL